MIQWDRYISCYHSALVHLLIIDEAGVLIISVEVHGILLQKVIIIAEVRIPHLPGCLHLPLLLPLLQAELPAP